MEEQRDLWGHGCVVPYLLLDVVVLELVEVLGKAGRQLLHLVDLHNQLLIADLGSGGHGAQDEIGAAQCIPQQRDLPVQALGAQQRADGGVGEAVQQLVEHPCRRRGCEHDGVEHC